MQLTSCPKCTVVKGCKRAANTEALQERNAANLLFAALGHQTDADSTRHYSDPGDAAMFTIYEEKERE